MPKKLAPEVRYAVKRKVDTCDLERDRKIYRFVKTLVTVKNDAEIESTSTSTGGGSTSSQQPGPDAGMFQFCR